VSYVDAGYAIALSVLFLYAVSLILRRRRGERALLMAERATPQGSAGAAPTGATGTDTGPAATGTGGAQEPG
jgi:hypothetical protein